MEGPKESGGNGAVGFRNARGHRKVCTLWAMRGEDQANGIHLHSDLRCSDDPYSASKRPKHRSERQTLVLTACVGRFRQLEHETLYIHTFIILINLRQSRFILA
jgi:hypothetical protein